MIQAIRVALLGVLCTAAGGCSAYLGDYQYSPRPAVATLTAQPEPQPPTTQPMPGQPQPPSQQPPQQPPAMAVLATVIGVHRADNNLHIPDSVEIRLRIDDNGPDDVIFDPQTITLDNGQLTPFARVIARPPQPITLNPQQTAYVTIYFPFPSGHNLNDTDMQNLQLRWAVQIGGQTVGQIAQFQRVYNYYYDGPYYYPGYAYPAYPVVGIGVGFGHRWR